MLKNSSVSSFGSIAENRRLICFGAGKNFSDVLNVYKWNVSTVIDSDENKKGQIIGNIQIRDWEEVGKTITENDILLITPAFFSEIYNRIQTYETMVRCDIYILELMKRLQYDVERDKYERKSVFFLQRNEKKIPKKIHYFWFSGDPYPESVNRCIESWKKFCPDYEIIKWDMNNYDFSGNRFALEAIGHRKWAFASDFARADVIYRYGGIYLDTDVQLVRGIDDLLYHDAFIGFQDSNEIDPGSGFGAAPGNNIVGEFRDIYKNISFDLGEAGLNTIACPVHYTEVLTKHGLVKDGSYQLIDGFAVYPYDYFCPHSYMSGKKYITYNTYSIHLHQGGWLNKEIKERELLVHELLATNDNL